MTDQIAIYDRATIDGIVWPATPDGDYARRVLGPIAREGARRFIANVDAEARVLRVGDVVDYPNAKGPAMTLGEGYGDWNVPWSQWLTGGAVPTR